MGLGLRSPGFFFRFFFFQNGLRTKIFFFPEDLFLFGGL